MTTSFVPLGLLALSFKRFMVIRYSPEHLVVNVKGWLTTIHSLMVIKAGHSSIVTIVKPLTMVWTLFTLTSSFPPEKRVRFWRTFIHFGT